MNKRNSAKISIVLIVLIMISIVGFWYGLDQSELKNTNKNSPIGLHYIGTENDGRQKYLSDIHKMSLLFPTSFSLDYNIERDKQIVINVFRRQNTNISEEPNRDTPDKFNTAADDILIVRYYPRKNSHESIFPLNQETIREYDLELGLPEISRDIEEFFIGNNKVIYLVKGGGIDMHSMYYYLESDEYVTIISSSDIDREEIENIISSIQI